ncbi:hypothetical protein BC351_36790 [Paenibacillus ferrarius]|uniref:Uncharacterized protein n=1 Tax=Paenibacillus ferrarius TaxID=1469647 RepID=A0A1V4HBL5_9BACL|nr:hypothetical protein [Paenibacillus ferrarius]OPH49674.1 hypothetical protein BC351_36790 [Paenibacillus ferrarius]
MAKLIIEVIFLNPYNNLYMERTLCLAFSGNDKAKKLICSIKEPFAVSNDFSQLFVVLEERPFECDIEQTQYVNRYRAEIYQCAESLIRDQPSLTWTYIPIPNKFNVKDISFDEGLFTFHSKDGDLIKGTLDEIVSEMRNVVTHSNTVTEDEIEMSFYLIRSVTQEMKKRVFHQRRS